ncbi:lysine N(6)-hydroxylase/L-ornithine N(5)-oxygenase family protein [Kribbella sp. NPDC051620]|uniref:lysine N(6)-hydroxylase/L-ornithine N(5)-oxygenase family protein n=1 Tax=Kribbella sp. NPDC051620 TaxID=3364120 RepID=UPI00379E3E73
MPRDAAQTEIYDAIGVGFGPSNLALAIALSEQPARLRTRYLERTGQFGWHRDMLIDGATMQVSFLKDLVTPRNPVSRHSFVAYLHQAHRFHSFVNQKTLFPTRIEFHKYLEWAASDFEHLVGYGQTVTGIGAWEEDGAVTAWEVTASGPDGEVSTTLTRNLVVATGLTPSLPAGVRTSDRIWHSSSFLSNLRDWRPPSRPRIAVIGAGQSAAEITAHLYKQYETAEIYSVYSRYGYTQSDDSPYANQVFDPQAVDDFYYADQQTKQSLYRYHANTNYSAVDQDLIEELYRRQYSDTVSGQERLRVVNLAKISEVRELAGKVRIELSSPHLDGPLDVDLAIFATGYRPMDTDGILAPVLPHCELGDDGRPLIGRDYRIATGQHVSAAIYLQGGTEASHGISSSLLSNTATRAGEIADSLTRTGRAATALPVSVPQD